MVDMANIVDMIDMADMINMTNMADMVFTLRGALVQLISLSINFSLQCLILCT